MSGEGIILVKIPLGATGIILDFYFVLCTAPLVKKIAGAYSF